MRTQRLILLTLLFAAWQAIPSFAASYSISAITNIVSDCSTNINLNIDLYFAGINVDVTSPDRDIVATYILDGDLQPIAGYNTWINVGAGGNVTNYALIPLSYLTTPQKRPFHIISFDVTAAAFYDTARLSPVLGSHSFDPADFGVCSHLPYGNPGESSARPRFSDGRINNWDMASPIVPYGHDYETGRGLVVYSPEGALLLEARPEDIAAVEECPSENTLIISAGEVVLYRLTSCQYQLNAPSLDGTKTYVLIFYDLYENTGYSSHEE